MSWIFGFNRSGQSQDGVSSIPSIPVDSSPTSGSDGSPGGGSQSKKTESTYRFDSAALERAAKAARELEASKYASEAFKLASEQERTKQLEYQAMVKQYSASEEQHKTENIKQHAEERRRLLEEETRQANIRNRYQDELARKRHEDQLRQQAALQEDMFRKQEESVAKQEAIRKQTSEYDAELKHQYEMKRLDAELKGKARIERDNRDIYLEQLKLKADENRKTVLESISTAGSVMGQGFSVLLNNPDKLVLTGTAVTLIAAGIYSARAMAGVAGKYVQSRLGRPALIRDTSRVTVTQGLTNQLGLTTSLLSKKLKEWFDIKAFTL